MLVTNDLKQRAEAAGQHVATVYNGNDLTYEQLWIRAQRLAAHLQKRYKKGDIVALFLVNSDDLLVAYYGIQLAGLTVMPVNTKLAVPEIAYIFEHSQARILLYDDVLRDKALATTYTFDETIVRGGANELRAILDDDNLTYEPYDMDPDEMAVVMYTSGTTGKPKGVMLSQRNVYEAAAIWSQSMQMTEHDRMFICTPLFHCAGLQVFAVPTLHAGGTVVISEAFSPDNTLQELVDTNATIFFGVPAMYMILLSRDDTKTLSFPHLRLFCYGAAPMPYEMVRKLKDTFPNVRVQNLYGQTENSPAATSLLDEDALTKIGSVGKPLPQTHIQIVDEYGQPLPVGAVGEIAVKGPQVMLGYLRNEEETVRALKNGWLLSGDLGRFDDEGFLYIVDRKKDMILRGGENVYPIEVEEALYEMPEILEAAVVGIPHEIYGEVPKAYVVLKEGITLTSDDITAHCKTRLASYKVPSVIEYLNELPRNASGKVLKHTLRPTVTN
ncbi:MAG: AMP-binding protein [Caryophanon sp.]|nr:AMP-binding protein [Caryophanon sp.]